MRTSSVDVLLRKMPRQGAVLGRASVIQITGAWATVDWLGAELSIPFIGTPTVGAPIWLLQQGTVMVGLASGGGGAGGSVAWVDITGKPSTFPPTAQPLDWLTDVSVAAPVAGQVLGYDGAAWSPGGMDWGAITGKPATFPPIPQPLDWLSDVYVGTPIAGQVLGYDGTSWAAQDIVASADWADITGKPATFPPTPQALDWLSDASSAGATDGTLLGYSAGQWVPVAPPVAVGGVAPVGTVVMWGAQTPPVGWLHCDGSAVNRITYADLFAVIGTTWGAGDGTTTFNLPDLAGKFPLGVGTTTPSGTARPLGGTGGADERTIASGMLPPHVHGLNNHVHNIGHNHPITRQTATGAGAGAARGGGGAEADMNTGNPSNTSSGAASGNTGDGAFNNNPVVTMPPYRVVNFIIKATPGGEGESTIAWTDILGKPTTFPPIPQPISWLTDVDTAGVTEDQVLTMKAGQWVGADPASISAVDWANITGKPTTFPPTPQALDWLTNVDAAAPASGDVLTFNGTAWVPGVGGGGGSGGDYLPLAGGTMLGNLSMGGKILHTTAVPSAGHHVGDRAYNDARYVKAAGDIMTGHLNMSGSQIQNLPKPAGSGQPLPAAYGYSIEAVGYGPTINIGTGTPSGGSDNDIWIQR